MGTGSDRCTDDSSGATGHARAPARNRNVTLKRDDDRGRNAYGREAYEEE